ncbi:hypothetical protein V496_00164 [Pseudogymnoascus sp. VKM F-4515 (FW-2607)]|nr:hypothetical protein V496_00164 [Pseudogymnoascus sp. VKM F-4515 (FW-2607)]
MRRTCDAIIWSEDNAAIASEDVLSNLPLATVALLAPPLRVDPVKNRYSAAYKLHQMMQPSVSATAY